MNNMATSSSPPPPWLAITTACSSTSRAISATFPSANRFIRDVRSSRVFFDDILTLLHSLDAVLSLLKDDAAALPTYLADVTPDVLEGCRVVVNEIDGSISVLGRSGCDIREKKARWLAGREHIGRLCGMLYGYRDILGLAVDLVALTKPLCDHDSEYDEMGRREELLDVVGRIEETRGHLHEEAPLNGAFTTLRWYLDALHAHAVAAIGTNFGHSEPDYRSFVVDEPPDSAIEVCDERRHLPRTPLPPAPTEKRLIPTPKPSVPAEDVDELLDELCEMPVMPNRPPTPPPRSRARSANSQRPPSVSESAHGSMSDPGQDLEQVASPATSVPTHRRDWSYALSQISSISDQTSSINQTPRTEDMRFEAAIQRQAFSSTWSDDSTGLTASTSPPTSANHRPSTSSSTPDPSRKPTRRSSFRLTSAFKGLHIRRNSKSKPEDTPTSTPPAPPSVFGSPLSLSIPIARGVAGTKHSRGGTSSQEYPLCILRCVYFIRDSGLSTPDIFDAPSDQLLLSELKAIFSSPETSYGKDLSWEADGFSVYEAADLITLFLSELPTPLIPPSLTKRWISLSRQATISGSFALRLDQGLDFWEEAFMGLKGPGRALFKLLLGLWGEVAERAEENDMTAERLAGRLVGPLLGKRGGNGMSETDVLLGLAFVIRKRAEYLHGVGGRGGRARAAFR